MRKVITTLIVICTICSSGFGQLLQNKITIHHDSVSFESIVKDIETKADCKFFYEESWIKTGKITIHETENTLVNTLTSLCNILELEYTFRQPNSIILSKDIQIISNYGRVCLNKMKEEILPIELDYNQQRSINTSDRKEEHINPELKIFHIGNSIGQSKGPFILSGRVGEFDSDGPIVGALIYIGKLKKATTTTSEGTYSMSIPEGQYKVEYRSLGMKTTYRNINIQSSGKLNVMLKNLPTNLTEVTVRENKNDKVRNLNIGVEKISQKALKQIPLGFGEVDIIKSTLMLPGVQSVGEASSGFNVRGGSIDQNLIIVNDAPIMNTSHFFGFFSGFNSEVIDDITLYKSGIPAKYGGRVSSVLDIKVKEGNNEKTKLSGGISPVSAKATLEGPIFKEKLSYIIGLRSTYSDWVLGLLDDYKLKNSKASFYDIQGGITYNINKKNKLQISGYKSHDYFYYYGEDAFDYNTTIATMNWKHTISKKLFSQFTLGISNYNYLMESASDSTLLHQIEYKLHQYPVRYDFTYYPNSVHKITFGLNGVGYALSPGKRTPKGTSRIKPKTIEAEQGVEAAAYLSDEIKITSRFMISGGLRLNYFARIGPDKTYLYREGVTKSEQSIIDSTSVQSGIIQSYVKPDYRFSSSFITGLNNSIKFGYNRMHQFIHMISNTASMSPNDIWMLSDNYIPPQRVDQYSFGFYQQIGKLDFSIESYYKDLKDVLSYKDGAELLMNDKIETDLLSAKGQAYGVECMLEKRQGRVTGWINYTYSRVKHKATGTYPEEIINNGEYFPANYDKPHDVKIVTNFKASRRFNITSNFSYSTGRPYTAPLAYFNYNEGTRVYYSDRNSLRMEDYIRWDLAATLNGNLRKNKLNHSSWTAAVYNVLGRQNPYSVFFRTENKRAQGYKMSIFAKPIFTLTYNFKLMGNASDDL